MSNLTLNAPHGVVRWIFQRGAQLLTCRVDRGPGGSFYTTSVVPHDNLELTAVETFKSGLSALQEHARVAAGLRQLGWTLIGYTNARMRRPAVA